MKPALLSRLPLPLVASIFLLFGACFGSQMSYGQEYSYIHYTMERGLPAQTIYDIAQDSIGFIWISTSNGLSRFDGTEFHNYSTEDGLPDNEILNLYVDSHNRLWYSTVAGVLGYHKEGRFFNSDDGIFKGERSLHSHFVSVYEDHLGQLWFGTHHSGLFALKEDSLFPTVEMKVASMIGEDSKGDMYLLGLEDQISGKSPDTRPNGVLVKINTTNFSVRLHRTFTPGTRTGFQPMLLNDTIAIGFSNFGMMIWNLTTDEYSIPFENSGIPVRVANHSIRLSDSKILYSFRSQGAREISFSIAPEMSIQMGQVYLENSDVTSCLKDHAGGLWFATMDDGLYYLPDQEVRLLGLEGPIQKKIARRLKPSNDARTGLLFKGTRIYQVDDSLAELARFDDNFNFDVRDMITLGDGALFATDMWLLWDPSPMLSTHLPTEYSTVLLARQREAKHLPYLHPALQQPGSDILGITTPPIKQLLNGSHGRVYVACSNALLELEINPKRQGSDAMAISKLIRTYRLYCLALGKGGTLWAGGEPGLMRLEGDSLVTVLGYEQGLKRRISKILTLPDSSILVATHGQGLFHIGTHGTANITRADGIESDICNDLTLDSDGLVWVATKRGLTVLTMKDGILSIHPHPVAKRLHGLNIELVLRLPDRLILTQGEKIVSAPLNRSAGERKPFKVILTHSEPEIRVDENTGKLQIPPEQANVIFDFVGLDYVSDGNIEYQYRLIGSDSNWTSTTQNSIEYSQLPHGEYTFEVRAIALDGTKSVNTAKVVFAVLPFWYQRWWFRILLGAGILALGGGIFVLRIKAINRRNTLELQLLESEQKALRSQMNPHFIFNSLNSIQRFLASNNPNESIRYLSKFGRLMRSILDHSRESGIPIREEIDSLRLYLELESLRTDHKFDFTIHLDPSLDDISERIPPLLLQPYVENAIWHGIMPKEGRGHITISLQDHGGSIYCFVEDDGIGREKAQALKGDNPTGRKSHGINITTERLALLNRDKPRAITVNITDLVDGTGVPLGTRVEMVIPKKF